MDAETKPMYKSACLAFYFKFSRKGQNCPWYGYVTCVYFSSIEKKMKDTKSSKDCSKCKMKKTINWWIILWTGLSDLADSYGLVKVGGSDFHGRSGCQEPDLGSVHLPVISIFDFLKLAQPIWCEALRDILTSDTNGEKKPQFYDSKELECFSCIISDKSCHDCREIELLGKKLSFVTVASR